MLDHVDVPLREAASHYAPNEAAGIGISEPYKRKPLDLDVRQIRLLRIWPYNNEIIACSLERCDIDQHDYVAVSYAWGPERPVRPVWI
jgi:hypothetical protein